MLSQLLTLARTSGRFSHIFALLSLLRFKQACLATMILNFFWSEMKLLLFSPNLLVEQSQDHFFSETLAVPATGANHKFFHSVSYMQGTYKSKFEALA